MDFDILDMVSEAAKETSSFENHPANDFSMEEKLLYLNGLALIMNSDGEIHESEKEYLSLLISSMEIEADCINDIVAFAQSPDKATIQAFFKSFRRRQSSQLFLFDALMMIHKDEKVHQKEMATLDVLTKQLEVPKGIVTDIQQLFDFVKNKNWESCIELLSAETLNLNNFKHILDYYDVTYENIQTHASEAKKKAIINGLKSCFEVNEDSNTFTPRITFEFALPLLQAEIDRGRVKNGKTDLIFRFEDNEYELNLESSNLVLAGDSQLTTNGKQANISNNMISIVVEIMKFIDVQDLLDRLFDRKIQISTGVLSEDKSTVKYKGTVAEFFPFLFINDVLYINQSLASSDKSSKCSSFREAAKVIELRQKFPEEDLGMFSGLNTTYKDASDFIPTSNYNLVYSLLTKGVTT